MMMVVVVMVMVMVMVTVWWWWRWRWWWWWCFPASLPFGFFFNNVIMSNYFYCCRWSEYFAVSDVLVVLATAKLLWLMTRVCVRAGACWCLRGQPKTRRRDLYTTLTAPMKSPVMLRSVVVVIFHLHYSFDTARCKWQKPSQSLMHLILYSKALFTREIISRLDSRTLRAWAF